MRTNSINFVTILLSIAGSIRCATAQGTAFTYQGRLSDEANAANGTYEFRFALFDAVSSGNQIGNAVTNAVVSVNDGFFTTALNFGAGAFPGGNRWLQIAVRTNGSGAAFTTLGPRQTLSATPYAQTAGDVTGANISRLNVPNTAVQATGMPTINFGFIVNAAVTSGGSGYAAPPTVTLNDPTGSGAAITASISGGVVVGLTVQTPGSGYSANATLTIGAPPSNAFQTFVTPNFFTGVNSMNNINNTFAGSFSGNGAGLAALNGGAIAAGSILNPSIADSTVTAAKIASGQVVKSINGLRDAVILSAGPNITLTPNGNGVQIASSASGGIAWLVVPGTTQQAQPNTSYLLTNNAQVTVTLPPSLSPGELVRISGNGTGGWKIAQNTNQFVLVKNLPGNVVGTIWAPRESIRKWRGVASSADGTKLIAVVDGGQIFTSTDSGVIWTPRESIRKWRGVASSADGIKLIAVADGDQIYTSTDSGVTWTPRDSIRNWVSIASSSDGTKLVAAANQGQIFTSTNSGALWTPHDSNRQWTCVASSSDGTELVAGAQFDNIYTSTDSGVTWIPRDSIRLWAAVASSSGGSNLVAAVFNSGQIYTSRDAGVTWTPRESARNWSSVASSSDGTKLVAAEQAGQIYTSTDFGVTWTPHESNRVWECLASSSDGSKLVAVDSGLGSGVSDGGQIYTSLPGSTLGASGYLLADPNSAIELQYLGNGQFMPLSHEGTIIAY